jgi:protein phosphatase
MWLNSTDTEIASGGNDLKSYGESKIGFVRKINEDSFDIFEEKKIFIVADGMGGYVAGEVASKIAVDTVRQYFKTHDLSLPAMEDAVVAANSAILDQVKQKPALNGMGTTFTILAVVNDKALWAHVGDSRVYLFRNGQLIRVTKDHSIVENLLQDGKLSTEEADCHPERNILTRAVGVDENIEVDTDSFTIYKNDRILLCTDGLNTMVSAAIIQGILGNYALSEKEVVEQLLDVTYKNGARDNVTVIVLTI